MRLVWYAVEQWSGAAFCRQVFILEYYHLMDEHGATLNNGRELDVFEINQVVILGCSSLGGVEAFWDSRNLIPFQVWHRLHYKTTNLTHGVQGCQTVNVLNDL